jgi:hypothetical protein
MNIVGLVLFVAAFLLILWLYYLFFNIAIAIWLPLKAKKKWVDFIATPAAQFSYFFLKWVAPLWVLLVSLSVLTFIVNFIMCL